MAKPTDSHRGGTGTLTVGVRCPGKPWGRRGRTSGGTWAKSSTYDGLVRRQNDGRKPFALRRTALSMAARRPRVRWKRREQRRPAANSTRIVSTRRTVDEIAGRQTLDRHCWAQNQREPGGRVLE